MVNIYPSTWSFQRTHVVRSEAGCPPGPQASPFRSPPLFPLDEGSREAAVPTGSAAPEPSLAASFTGDFFLGGSCLWETNGGPGALELEAVGRMTADHGTLESPDVGKSISAIALNHEALVLYTIPPIPRLDVCERHHVVERAQLQKSAHAQVKSPANMAAGGQARKLIGGIQG